MLPGVSMWEMWNVRFGHKKNTQGYWYIEYLFRAFPRLMADSAAIISSFIRNSFTSDTHGLFKYISPRTLITGLGNLRADRQLKVQWSIHCEIFLHNDVTNDVRNRTVLGIALHPANNNRGFFFMSLDTRKKITSNQ